ncbi:MAG: outer membrane beta-barrel protein [Deltaproteobacteria bacterium]|nr:outer membrane beta-barrel protein [Deltaproteobacteria bacterium]
MKWKLAVGIFLLIWLAPLSSLHAASSEKASQNNAGSLGEISLMGSFSKSDFGNGTYSTTRRYTATFGLNLNVLTELEVSYAYTDNFFNGNPVQTTSVNEQSLGLSLVQGLLPPKMVIAPYVKVGAAQYNRTQNGSISGIPTTPQVEKSPSGILGGGLRIFLLRNFSLKIEVVTYLPNFNISGAKNNFSAQGGIGWEF